MREERKSNRIALLFSLVLSVLIAGDVFAAASATNDYDYLPGLSLKELMGVAVTTVSRKSESFSDAPAAVTVITQQDICRSGATSIPDLLRMVPGVEVAQFNDNDWFVTMRGFNGETENKLLVLIDGRSVYSPVFSGVFWYEQDLILADIERIEVIRGPGAAMWGANAVNGVINIITKSAAEQQGARVSVTGGTWDRMIASGRYGWRVSEHSHAAAWVKAFERDQFGRSRNGDVLRQDEWESILFGCRYDWDPPTPELLSLQFGWRQIQADDFYNVHLLAPPYLRPEFYRRHGTMFHALGKYTRSFSEKSEASVQVYYDDDHNDFGNGDLRYRTFDVDSQVRFPVGSRQDVLVGAGYRLVWDDLFTPEAIRLTLFDPVEASRSLFTAFVDDEVTLVPDRLDVKVGCKVEHNEYTHWEVQPSARLRLTPHEGHMVWAAVSRAVRTPSRLDSDTSGELTVPPSHLPPPFNTTGQYGRLVIPEGDPDSEELIAYELGYRAQLHRRLVLDVTAFYNDYDRLRTYVALTPGYVPAADDPDRLNFLIAADNGKSGHTCGFETLSRLEVSDAWSLVGTYSYLDMDLELDPGSLDLFAVTGVVGKSPRHQFSIRSLWDVTRNLRCDVWIRHVSELPALAIDSYTTVDVRLGWMATPNLELSVVGRNLGEEWHSEFGPYEVERSVHCTATVTF